MTTSHADKPIIPIIYTGAGETIHLTQNTTTLVLHISDNFNELIDHSEEEKLKAHDEKIKRIMILLDVYADTREDLDSAKVAEIIIKIVEEGR